MGSRKDGALTRAFVNFEGKEIELKLSVIRYTEKYFGCEEELSFTSSERPNPKIVIKSFYSGGLTGGGIDSWDLHQILAGKKKKDYEVEVVADTPEGVFEWIDEQDRKEKVRIEEFNQEQKAAVKYINSLPDIFPIEGLSTVRVRRSEAYYNKEQSRAVKFSVTLEHLNRQSEWCQIFRDFTTSDGKMKIKQFKEEMCFLFGEGAERLDPKETLKKMIEMKKHVETVCKKKTLAY